MATENPKITHIERVEIKGLWGKYDIDWQLNPDVNILVGINGSGKSTVLGLIDRIIDEDVISLSIMEDKSQIDLFFNNQNSIVVSLLVENGNSVLFNNKEFTRQYNFNFEGKSFLYTFQFSTFLWGFLKENKLNELINTSIVNSFEVELPPLEALQQLTNKKAKTQLDLELYYLLNEYPRFFSKLSNRQRKEKTDDVFAKDDLFKTLVNQAFSKTNKTILINDESDINFQLGDKILSPYDLSSGEKQLLIILLKVLIQDNQPYILLMDEPEVSLHLEWQFQLIENIRQLNENCQIILATHSPAVFGKGKGYKVTNMEEITHKLKPISTDAN